MLWIFGIVALQALFGIAAFRYVCKRLSNLEWLLTVPAKRLADAATEQERLVEEMLLHRTYGLQPRPPAVTSRPYGGVNSMPLRPMTVPDPWPAAPILNGHAAEWNG